ncbi:MAG: hypothetical protein H7Z41_15015 [Cytophagales bacterium]|nr:hypothetical protein [Armatimonadota bacterium]
MKSILNQETPIRPMMTDSPPTFCLLRRIAAALALLFAASALPMARAALPPTPSQGTFVDTTGGRHSWVINSAHTLIWDSKPFLPVGGLFQMQSWVPNASEADFIADKAALAAIKARGVTDVILQPAQGGITGVTPAALQRAFDYLDAQGLTYGISLADGPREPLAAYEVRPGAYRLTAAGGGPPLRFAAENLMSSLYFVVTPTGSDVIARGQAQMIPEGARVETPAVSGQMIAFLVPEKLYFVGSPMGVPNLWDGYDSYRDSILTLFGQVRLGKGFRFFVDALPPSLNLSDEALRLIPDSPGFRTEWGAYLTRKYRTLETLDVAWSITNRDVPSFEAAAALLPLWNGGKGVSLYYDRYTRKEVKTDFTRSAFWNDLRAFMTDSVRGYMNDLAIALKHGVADVPVVYRSQGSSLLFSRLPGGEGFDGIGIDAYGRGRDLISAGGAGEVYAQASEAGRTLWLPVTATNDDGPGAGAKKEGGYVSRAALISDFDWLRDLGARGFYVDSLRTLDPARVKFNIGDLPGQLTWLSDYQSLLTASVRTGGPLDTLPGVTYFPRGLNTASIRLLTGGEWWLPTDRPGSLYDFGTAGSTYALTEPDGSATYYLWNPSGVQRTIHLKLPPQVTKNKEAPRVQWSASANGTVKGDTLALTIGPDPIRLLNYPTVPLPVEAFDEAYGEAQKLAAEMKKRDALERGLYGVNLPQLRMQYQKRGDPWFGYTMLRETLLKMRTVLRDYAWLEAEGEADASQAPISQSFDAIEERVGASGGRVLVVGKRAANMPRAAAQYRISVNKPGTFQLWAAASPGAPLTFLLNGKSVIDEGSLAPRTPSGPGAAYAGGSLAWIYFGPVTLPQGTHTLEVRASGPATLDTLLLQKGDFTPNGPNPPPVLPQ